ncbi:MAG: NADH-quinone oxidoreductase subunit NuoH [Chloroflexi bacterium]|nr:NADH-quinone oxidoreductase subunit NuoH [Chloroflexota bacterium]
MNFLDPRILGEGWNHFLNSLGLSSGWIVLINGLVVTLILLGLGLTSVLFAVWLERKVAARVQDRLGPNRVGPYGLVQTVADALKLLTKEDITPDNAERISYNLAPGLAVFAVLMLLVVIPFGPGLVGADIDVGVLYIVAMGSVGIMAILMAGWSSNNKYALLGGFRAVAQLLSYEIPMILAMSVPVLFAGTMKMGELVERQAGFRWFGVVMPAAFFLYFLAALAENERTPFDLLEADSEIVAGYHIEYSAMKFAWFFLAFFLNTLILSAIATTLFLGGWRGPFVEQVPILGIFYFLAKSFVLVFAFMWIRATFPRLRIDQMMAFAWKVMVPTGLVLVLVAAVFAKLPVAPVVRDGLLFLVNIIILLVVAGFVGRHLRLQITRLSEA